jgi:cytochrome c-type biogenesis protein
MEHDVMDNVTLIPAFAAGVASFISPCVLPLVPGYISFISGVSLERLRQDQTESMRRSVILTSLVFIAGFSTIFILLGASATYAGRFLLQNKILFNRIAGIVIILFGLQLSF